MLNNAMFHGCFLTETLYLNEDLEGASFDRSRLIGTKFIGCRLVDVSFRGAYLRGVVVEDCQILRVDLTGADCDEISRANLRG